MIIDINKKIEEFEKRGCDICEHFPLMLKYGKQCEHITEMGVREVVSTWGWIASNPKKLVCYDIQSCSVDNATDTCAALGIDFSFYVADTREIEIEETYNLQAAPSTAALMNVFLNRNKKEVK